MVKLALQTVGSLIVSVFLIGVAYQSLAGHDKSQEARIASVEVSQQILERTVTTIQIDIATLVANQENQKEILKEQKEDTKQIIGILQQILVK